MEKALPPDRHRKIQAITNEAHWFKPYLHSAIDEIESLKKIERPKPEVDINDIPINKLVDALLKKVDTHITNIISQYVESSLLIPRIVSGVVAALNASKPAARVDQRSDKPKLKKVLIVGLLDEQVKQIQSTYGELFNLSFSRKTAAGDDIATQAKLSDHTIAMIKFVSHSQSHAAKSGNNLIYCSGGMTELEHILDRVFKVE